MKKTWDIVGNGFVQRC